METLKKASDDADLIKFAEDNICFISTAPHEWLFPQCACIIHHGGAGTTNCTIRAGVPQVITPVFLDQFDHAYLVKKLGIGFGFSKQLQTLTSKELGDAIKTTVESTEMSLKAAEVGKEVAAEDGVQWIVDYIPKYWKEYICSGKQKDFVEDRLAKNRDAAWTCFG